MNIPSLRNNKRLVWYWEYKSFDGQSVLGVTARYELEGKKEVIPFFNRNADGSLSKGYPKDMLQRPLFGLDTLSAVSEAYPIMIVEGEKCAVAVHSLGLPAVTSPGGSNAAGKADWSPLSGKPHVVIAPDNDEPGIKYAKDVYNILMMLPHPPKKITLLELSDLPPKGDVVDWLLAQGLDRRAYHAVN